MSVIAPYPTPGAIGAEPAGAVAAHVAVYHPPADRRPPPLVHPAWDVIGAWRAGYGTTDRLADASGNGIDLALTAGSAPTLAAADTGAGADALVLDGSQTFAASTSGLLSRHGAVFVLVTRPTADGTYMDDTDGWRLALAGGAQLLTFGQLGGEAASPAAMRQYSALVGWSAGGGSPLALPSCNQRGAGALTPGVDTGIPGIRVRGAQRFVAACLLRLRDATTLPTNELLSRLYEPLYRLVVPSGPKSLMCRGNSLIAGVGLAYADTVPGRLATQLGAGWKVGTLAVPSMVEDQGQRFAAAQADGATGATVDVYAEITNNLAFGPDAGNGTAAAARFLANVRARRSARPATKFVVWDCVARTDLAGGNATYATQRTACNAALATAYGVATADAAVWLSADPTLAGTAMVRLAALSPVQPDGVHFDAATNGTAAAKTVLAMTALGVSL